MAIARLPLLQMQQQRMRTNDQQAAVTELQGRFQSLKLAFDEVGARVSATQLTTSFSSNGIASATLGEAAQKGTYSLEVLSLGNFTSFLSATAAADPVSDGLGTELTKTLVVDGVETTLTLETNSLRALADAINAASGGLEASVINVSSTADPSYKLVIQGSKYGEQVIELRDGDGAGTNLLEGAALQSGQAVSYKVNGVSVEGESRNVTIAPGVEVQFTAVSNGPVSLTIGRSANSVRDAIQSMVAAYNQASGKLSEHRGAEEGALQGSSTVLTLSQVLRRVTGFSMGSGEFRTVADLGLAFDDKGNLTFDSANLSGLSEKQLDEVLAFLGNESGEGLVGAALSSLKEATDSEFGILATEKNSLTARLKTADNQMLQMQERLDRTEQDLRDRFAIVDSTIAALQQQAVFINSMFEAMRISMQVYSN